MWCSSRKTTMQNSKCKVQSARLFRTPVLAFAFCILQFAIFYTFAAAQGDAEGITRQYREALEINPDDMDARYLLGVSMLRENAYDEALQHLIKVYPHRSGEADVNYNIGLAYAGAGELEKAFRHYLRVGEINAIEARGRYRLDTAFYNLGISYQKVGNLDEALRCYQEAIRINPEQVNAFCAQGEALYQKKDYKGALESFAVCKEKSPERKGVSHFISAIHQDRGIEYINQKNYTEARIELDKAITLDTGNETVHYYMGYLEYLEGDYKKALLALDKVKGTEREDMKKALSSMLYNVGGAMQKDEDWEGAVNAFSQAAAISKQDPELRFYLGYSNMKAKRFDAAIEAFKDALKLDTKHQRAAVNLAIVSEIAMKSHLNLGEDYLKNGSYNEALKEFNLSLSIDPGNQKGLKGKDAAEKKIENLKGLAQEKRKREIAAKLLEGDRFIAKGKYLEAKKSFEEAAALEPGNQKAREGIGKTSKLLKEAKGIHDERMSAGIKAYKEGSYSQALSAFGDALQVDPNRAEAQKMQMETRARIGELIGPWLKAGADAYKKGDTDSAIISFKKVLNTDPANQEAGEYLGKMDTQKAKASVDKEIEKHYLKGIERYTEGKYREAIESWKKVLELDSGHEKAILNIEKAKRKMEGVMDTK